MKTIKKGEETFESTLDVLQKKFFHNGGDPDAEEIWNRSKREVQEEGGVSLYATNAVISRAIKRNRKDIVLVRFNDESAELHYDVAAIRGGEYLIKPDNKQA